MRALALTVAVCFCLALAPFAQPTASTLTGRVTDASGSAVPGARVTMSAQGLSAVTAVTNTRGEFRFDGLKPGIYQLTAKLAGFQDLTKAVSLKAGTNSISLVMRVATTNEQATVTNPNAAPVPPPAAPVRVGGNITAGVAGGVVGGIVGSLSPAPSPWLARGDFNTATYDRIEDNPFRLVGQDPLSTFSIDVDTASYSNVRRFINEGRMPPADAVRIEELINYFRYDYPRPRGDAPFSVTTELAPCPWNDKHHLALIGLQATAFEQGPLPPRSLVFLLDVSGSMQPADKLPLIRTAMRMLVDTLRDEDRIAIVVYAGASGLALPTTTGAHKARIHEAIARLEAGGSTNGADGIALAYRVAQEQFVQGGINRVILATDGDFNVGVTSQGELVRMIEEKRQAGIFLSVLGVGTDNLKDSTMEKLADKGNGNYAYLDSLHEARKVLVRESGATLVTVAKDVKIQVEFNPAQVSAYRLIGYENRVLRNEDFNNDRKDAGEIGAGHTVTALYEVVPPGAPLDEVSRVDPLKYQRPAEPKPGGAGRDELMTVKLRYKAPNGDQSKLASVVLKNRAPELTANAGFAAAVAEFGMLLRTSAYRGTATFSEVTALARRFRGTDPDGYRSEFIRLVELAEALKKQSTR